MPVVRVECLPEMREDELKGLFEQIRELLSTSLPRRIPVEDLTVLFPRDMMKYGLGEEIIVTVEDYDIGHKRERLDLADALGNMFRQRFQNSRIKVRVRPVNFEDGRWDSKRD